ncbi:DUF805 domain-containing protein [Pectinatus brassicae]|uniref:Uncharacterized membrane protein YhaH (DUF805 family) n=1 Tax=Pectinatus brassicae TaxID=862415 RepID=A0A840UX41_9FIRM|nr:DUF805 domain-containing protein [Pectinatus brassicae]MBB5337424.1 uncharacterized membrane protein YhaH (DUF805 family) [Pectinatus brassicae]
MTLTEAVQSCIKENYANFKGRASRSEYWYFSLAIFLLSILHFIITAILAGSLLGGIISGVFGIIFLAICVPSIAVGVRRFHDIDKSGWNLLWGIIPLIGSLLVLYWTVQPSQDGDNKYGSAPQD